MRESFLFVLIILITWLPSELNGQNNVMHSVKESKIKAVYGFSKGLPSFKHKTNVEIVSILQEWEVNAIFGDYEDFDLVDQLHRAGIKVFVEVSFFVGEKWWRDYPVSRPVKDNGTLLEKEDWYAGVNPMDTDVFKAVLNKIQRIITSNTVDGIWLDFFRWPCHWESPKPNLYQTSFDDRTINLFLTEKRITIPNNISNPIKRNQWILEKHLNSWAEFKCDQIVRLAEKVRQLVKSKNENIIIGLFHVPWTNEDFNNALKKIVGQDLARLSSHIDIFSPMVYHAMCGKSPQWVQEITKYVYQTTNKPVLPIIQSMNIPRELSDTEFLHTLEFGLQADGSSGTIVFNLNGLNEAKLLKLKKVFEQY